MKKVGLVGWRGLVGSVLLSRMTAEKDFLYFTPYFFSTSQAGGCAPEVGQSEKLLLDAYRLDSLREMDVILTCQGSDYTARIHKALRQTEWQGFWLDAASLLRLEKSSVIVLDPVNQAVIESGLARGIKTFVGGNCTVSLMLLALKGLFAENLVEWVSSMTYQAVSGAGAAAMQHLLKEIRDFHPNETHEMALLGNLWPWIDKPMPSGQSKEEWKGMQEAHKILQTPEPIPIDGTCVRVGVFRAHSQALTVKLKQSITLASVTDLIQTSHQWLKWVPNEKEQTLHELTPLAVSGTLDIAVGRVRKMTLGDRYLNLFTVGDQLLWGAAEPLRRMLKLFI